MPKEKRKPLKLTRRMLQQLDTPISQRRAPRIATQFPSLNSYTALPGHPGVTGARKDGHLFINFTAPVAQTRIPVTGHYGTDAAEAQRRTGVVATPAQTWHHVADIDERRTGTIQLVPTATHAAIGHWGGTAISKRYTHAHTGMELDDKGAAVAVPKPKRSRV